MDHTSIDIYLVIDTFLLLLIGIGPKIALVPFLEVTAAMDGATKALVVRKMLVTAGVCRGHPRRAGRAAGKAAPFLDGVALDCRRHHPRDHRRHNGPRISDPQHRAPARAGTRCGSRCSHSRSRIGWVPAGIVTLVTLSAEADSVAVFAMVLGVLAVVLALDVAVFRWANRVSDHLDEGSMLVTEKIFGFLLAALAVQLVLDGLDSVGVLHLSSH